MADRGSSTGDAGRSAHGHAEPPVVEPTVPPGSDEYAGAVWELKERIRRLEGLLDQRRPFFDAQYRQSSCYLAVVAGDVVGFAVVRPDGYLSLLGVAPGHRRRGIGSRLLARAVDDHPALACHVRATNGDAVGFYAGHGFVVERRVPGYYRDGTDAYLLARDPERAGRLGDLLG